MRREYSCIGKDKSSRCLIVRPALECAASIRRGLLFKIESRDKDQVVRARAFQNRHGQQVLTLDEDRYSGC